MQTRSTRFGLRTRGDDRFGGLAVGRLRCEIERSLVCFTFFGSGFHAQTQSFISTDKRDLLYQRAGESRVALTLPGPHEVATTERHIFRTKDNLHAIARLELRLVQC